jgi:hypothetical protein
VCARRSHQKASLLFCLRSVDLSLVCGRKERRVLGGQSLMPISSGQVFVWQPPIEPGQASRESCTTQAIISGAVGGVAGAALGAVLAPFQSNVTALENQDLPMKEQMRRGMREIGSQSRSWGRNLMVVGAVFQCSECFVAKARGSHDRWNPIYGGCVTGGVLASSGARRSALRLAPASNPACPPNALAHDSRCCRPVLLRAHSRTAGHGHGMRRIRPLLGSDRRDGLWAV